jgi:hypothetical protein
MMTGDHRGFAPTISNLLHNHVLSKGFTIMTHAKPQEENVIFCDLSVFTDAQREQHMTLANELFTAVTDIQESDEGYALRMPDDAGIILKMAEFINDDRRCCAFIHFGMDIKAYGKGIWLTLKGGADVKAAIRAELLSLIPDEIASKAGL